MCHRNLILDIVLKYNRGEALSEPEQAELEAWRERSLADPEELFLFDEHDLSEQHGPEKPDVSSDKTWDRISGHIEKQRAKPPAIIRWLPVRSAGKVAVGLAILIVLGATMYRYSHPGAGTKAAYTLALALKLIGPGHYRGLDTLMDGRQQEVDSTLNQQAKPDSVVLPDGSLAILSYGSSLWFAPRFNDSVREVFARGEVCFDVVHDPHRRFVVHSNLPDVNVLGTRFDVMDYPGVPPTCTVLDGKVQLVRDGKKMGRQLESGDEAVIHWDSGSVIRLRISTLDKPQESVAWLDSRPAIQFDGADVRTVLQRFSQYHGLQFSIPESYQTKPVNGAMVLTNSVEDNLRFIELTQDNLIHCSLKGKLIIVTIIKPL